MFSPAEVIDKAKEILEMKSRENRSILIIFIYISGRITFLKHPIPYYYTILVFVRAIQTQRETF